MTLSADAEPQTFRLILIKPSHYDDDGYVIQWVRSAIPANTLAVLNGLAVDCEKRKVLGANVAIEISCLDETNTRIKPRRLIRSIREANAGLVCLVGVQSNQFPRALDIARPLREAGVPVCIGGFHVSGCLAMLPEPPLELTEALDMGISLFAGEAEGRLEGVLKDVWAGKMKGTYNYMGDIPSLKGAPTPILPANTIKRTGGALTSFDAGRGCPFHCSFCTIINVQGRKSRFRSADDVERLIRANAANGITSYFLTDDNFARNKNWEAILDRIIELREEGLTVHFIMQVDTLSHQVKGFIKKAATAGCKRVFIGLENINPDNLTAIGKSQNRITEYRAMLQAWKKAGIITVCAYIIGFPGDTRETVLRDVEIIKRELPTDLLEFFCLTPLPGSEDHKNLYLTQAAMDKDMNHYDLEHICIDHPVMSREEWMNTYHAAWDAYYTEEHVATIMRRARATDLSLGKLLFLTSWFYGCKTIENLHPLEAGYLRRKHRRDRRPGLPRENPLTFYPRYLGDLLIKHAKFLRLVLRWSRPRAAVKRDPNARSYLDLALTPVSDGEFAELDMFTGTDAARKAVGKQRKTAAKARVTSSRESG